MKHAGNKRQAHYLDICEKGKIRIGKMQMEINQAISLLNTWKARVKESENKVQVLYRKNYTLHMRNPLGLLERKLAKIVKDYDRYDSQIHESQRQGDILQKMKSDR